MFHIATYYVMNYIPISAIVYGMQLVLDAYLLWHDRIQISSIALCVMLWYKNYMVNFLLQISRDSGTLIKKASSSKSHHNNSATTHPQQWVKPHANQRTIAQNPQYLLVNVAD